MTTGYPPPLPGHGSGTWNTPGQSLPPSLLPLASAKSRTIAGAITAAFSVMVVGIGCIIGAMSRDSSTFWSTVQAMVVPGVAAGMLWLAMVFGLLAGTAASPGQWVLGLGAVSRETGQLSGAKAVRKEALLVGLGILTLGVLPVVLLLRRNLDTGENALDRMAGTVVVQRQESGELTEGSGFLSALWNTQPRGAVAVAHPGTAPKAPVVSGEVRLDQGTRLPLDRTWVLGRNPTAPPSHPQAEPFSVPDLDKTLSKSHVVLSAHLDGVEVTDLYSTNGVELTLPDGQRVELVPGRSAVAPYGSTITWGARTMEVHRC